MRISAISNNYQSPCFKSKKDGYENPIDRKTEKNLSILQSTGVSVLLGVTAGGIASTLMKEGAKHKVGISVAIGAAVAALAALLTMPAKIYDTKVKAFTREKEMDVFSRDKELKSNILTEVDKEVKDEDVSLDKKIDHYTQVQMANNGSGMLIKGA